MAWLGWDISLLHLSLLRCTMQAFAILYFTSLCWAKLGLGCIFALLVFSTLHRTWLICVGIYLCLARTDFTSLNSSVLYFIWIYLCFAKLVFTILRRTKQNFTVLCSTRLHSTPLCFTAHIFASLRLDVSSLYSSTFRSAQLNRSLPYWTNLIRAKVYFTSLCFA